MYMEVLAPERSGAVAGAQTLLGSSHSLRSAAGAVGPHHSSALDCTVAGRLVAEGLENRNKARAAAKRWTTFYASDLEGDTGRFGEI